MAYEWKHGTIWLDALTKNDLKTLIKSMHVAVYHVLVGLLTPYCFFVDITGSRCSFNEADDQ